jgi:two-component system OmpR family sensor kinase
VNRIFFRFFMLVMLSITVATFVIYFAMSRLFGDPLEDIARRQAAAQIFLLEQYVDKAPADEWLVRLNKVREVSDVRFDLMPLAAARALPAGQRARSTAAKSCSTSTARLLPARRPEGRALHRQRRRGHHARSCRSTSAWRCRWRYVRYVIVALALLIPIALWSRSHWQGLQSLSRVADEFGAGKLSARATC